MLSTGSVWLLRNEEQVRKGASVARPRYIDGGGVAPFLTCPARQALLVFKLNQYQVFRLCYVPHSPITKIFH